MTSISFRVSDLTKYLLFLKLPPPAEGNFSYLTSPLAKAGGFTTPSRILNILRE
jgi:hypothetical protein